MFAYAEQPKISIITSLYKGEEFIEGFMETVVQQTVFDKCELIIINANSPENEGVVIKRYLEKYPNIFYFQLVEDPGLYATWNIGIEIAQGEFITNANVDDRVSCDCYEKHLKALEENEDIDLVYSDFYLTCTPNETFEQNNASWAKVNPDFSVENMKDCFTGPNPMWRKSVHEKYGLFDESYKHSGDWEMWCRAVAGGAKFLRVDGCHCLYFLNPKGVSTDREKIESIIEEDRRVVRQYKYLWEKEEMPEVKKEVDIGGLFEEELDEE